MDLKNRKSKIFVISGHRLISNFIIFLMLVGLTSFAVFGANFTYSSKVFENLYYSGNENSKKVTLMINVYWGTEFLDDILQVLKDNNVQTTFFVGGTWAVRESEMLQKIYNAGHEIGNHGYYHGDHSSMSVEKNQEEISNTHKLVKSILGVDMNLFAPPSGSFSKNTVEVASQLGYKTIMWTEGRDTIDWRDQDADVIYERAVKNCKGGDFVLMHPTKATLEALDQIIKTLQNQGFQLCTVSDNLI